MAPASPITLRDYALRHRVSLACPNCQQPTAVNLMRWAMMLGWDFPFATLLLRLRCGHCGNHVGLEVRLDEAGPPPA